MAVVSDFDELKQTAEELFILLEFPSLVLVNERFELRSRGSALLRHTEVS